MFSTERFLLVVNNKNVTRFKEYDACFEAAKNLPADCDVKVMKRKTDWVSGNFPLADFDVLLLHFPVGESEPVAYERTIPLDDVMAGEMPEG